jgi:hypothetical protein
MPDYSSSMAQQLQLSAAHLPILRAVMQRELQALTPRSPQLALAGRIQQQRQHNAQPAQQCRVEVVPLLGLCLSHILHTSLPPSQQDDAGMHPAGEAAAPAEVYAAMQQHSPFLNALQSELRSLRAVSGTCYAQIKQHLASVGQHLPPAAASSSGGRASCDAANNTASTGDRSTSTSSNRGSSDYYGRGLDLQALQQQADAGALDLIHLEDCISSCATSLAKLAQQYDVLITAALAAAAEHTRGAAAWPQDAPPAKAAAAASHKAGGLLGPLLGAMRGGGSKQAVSKDAAAAGQQQAADAVEYVFMSPGVCSHSNAAQTYSYTAGMQTGWLLCCLHVLQLAQVMLLVASMWLQRPAAPLVAAMTVLSTPS